MLSATKRLFRKLQKMIRGFPFETGTGVPLLHFAHVSGRIACFSILFAILSLVLLFVNTPFSVKPYPV